MVSPPPGPSDTVAGGQSHVFGKDRNFRKFDQCRAIRSRCPDNAGDRPRCTSTGIHCLEGTKADGAPESCIQCKTYGEQAKHLRIERNTQFSRIDRFEAKNIPSVGLGSLWV
jgi:hypothetical protein